MVASSSHSLSPSALLEAHLSTGSAHSGSRTPRLVDALTIRASCHAVSVPQWTQLGCRRRLRLVKVKRPTRPLTKPTGSITSTSVSALSSSPVPRKSGVGGPDARQPESSRRLCVGTRARSRRGSLASDPDGCHSRCNRLTDPNEPAFGVVSKCTAFATLTPGLIEGVSRRVEGSSCHPLHRIATRQSGPSPAT
jgi:hypothetical protein